MIINNRRLRNRRVQYPVILPQAAKKYNYIEPVFQIDPETIEPDYDYWKSRGFENEYDFNNWLTETDADNIDESALERAALNVYNSYNKGGNNSRGAVAGAIGSAASPILKQAIAGKKTATGTAGAVSLGLDTLGTAAMSTGTVPGLVIGALAKFGGAGIHALWGNDQEAVNQNRAFAKQANNFQINTNDNNAIALASTMVPTTKVKRKSYGILNGNTYHKDDRNMKQGNAFAMNQVYNAANRALQYQYRNALLNNGVPQLNVSLSALGGCLYDTGGVLGEISGPIEYENANSYLTNGAMAANRDNKLTSVPNSFALGGNYDDPPSGLDIDIAPLDIDVAPLDINPLDINIGNSNPRGTYGGGTFKGAGARSHWGPDSRYVQPLRELRVFPVPTVKRTFNDAYAEARRKGLKTFEFDGKTYSTDYDNSGDTERAKRHLQAGNSRKEYGWTLGAAWKKKACGGSLNKFDLGGVQQTAGLNFPTGLVHIDAGGTHELNPNEGVPMGVDRNGTPNLVEEGEVVFGDYVFSNRLIVPVKLTNKKTKKLYAKGGRLHDTITYEDKVLKPYEGMFYADAAKKIEKQVLGEDFKGKVNTVHSPDLQAALEAILDVLAQSQEKERAKEQPQDLSLYPADMMNQISPEDLAMLLQEMGNQQQYPAEEEQMQNAQFMQDPMLQAQMMQLLMAAQGGMPQNYGACGGRLYSGGSRLLDEDEEEVEYAPSSKPANSASYLPFSYLDTQYKLTLDANGQPAVVRVDGQPVDLNISDALLKMFDAGYRHNQFNQFLNSENENYDFSTGSYADILNPSLFTVDPNEFLNIIRIAENQHLKQRIEALKEKQLQTAQTEEQKKEEKKVLKLQEETAKKALALAQRRFNYISSLYKKQYGDPKKYEKNNPELLSAMYQDILKYGETGSLDDLIITSATNDKINKKNFASYYKNSYHNRLLANNPTLSFDDRGRLRIPYDINSGQPLTRDDLYNMGNYIQNAPLIATSLDGNNEWLLNSEAINDINPYLNDKYGFYDIASGASKAGQYDWDSWGYYDKNGNWHNEKAPVAQDLTGNTPFRFIPNRDWFKDSGYKGSDDYDLNDQRLQSFVAFANAIKENNPEALKRLYTLGAYSPSKNPPTNNRYFKDDINGENTLSINDLRGKYDLPEEFVNNPIEYIKNFRKNLPEEVDGNDLFQLLMKASFDNVMADHHLYMNQYGDNPRSSATRYAAWNPTTKSYYRDPATGELLYMSRPENYQTVEGAADLKDSIGDWDITTKPVLLSQDLNLIRLPDGTVKQLTPEDIASGAYSEMTDTSKMPGLEDYLPGFNGTHKWYQFNEEYQPEDIATYDDLIAATGIKQHNHSFPRPSAWPFYVGAGLQLGSLGYNLLVPPSYANANAMINLSKDAKYMPIAPTHIGDYVTYRPYDRNYYGNRIITLGNTAGKQMLNLSAGNLGNARAGVLANNANTIDKLGLLDYQADQANWTRNLESSKFNRETNQFDAEADLKAAMSNQDAYTRASHLALTGQLEGYKMRQAIDDARSNAISAGITGLANLAYNYGLHRDLLAMLDWLLQHNPYPIDLLDKHYTGAKGGKINRRKKTKYGF